MTSCLYDYFDGAPNAYNWYNYLVTSFTTKNLYVVDPIVIHNILTMIHTIIRVELNSGCRFSLASIQTSEHVLAVS